MILRFPPPKSAKRKIKSSVASTNFPQPPAFHSYPFLRPFISIDRSKTTIHTHTHPLRFASLRGALRSVRVFEETKVQLTGGKNKGLEAERAGLIGGWRLGGRRRRSSRREGEGGCVGLGWGLVGMVEMGTAVYGISFGVYSIGDSVFFCFFWKFGLVWFRLVWAFLRLFF